MEKQPTIFDLGARPPTTRTLALRIKDEGTSTALDQAQLRADAARYQEVTCRSALNAVKGMPFNWTLNPYRGCTHACHYCFARRYQTQFALGPDDEFSSVIFVKSDVAQQRQRRLAVLQRLLGVVHRLLHLARQHAHLAPAAQGVGVPGFAFEHLLEVGQGQRQRLRLQVRPAAVADAAPGRVFSCSAREYAIDRRGVLPQRRVDQPARPVHRRVGFRPPPGRRPGPAGLGVAAQRQQRLGPLPVRRRRNP